jgi:thiamine pyrophosphokinase
MAKSMTEKGERRCVIIGAAPIENYETAPEFFADDYILCADGGLEHAKVLGLHPDLVVGDFDSLQDAEGKLEGLNTLQLPVEKDDTDTMAAIKIALEQGFRHVLIYGGTGGRWDHTFANYTALLYLSKRQATGVLTDGVQFVTVLSKGCYHLQGKKGWGLSVFPFGGANAVFSESGVYYPLKKYRLTAEFPLGVSNEITADEAVLQVHRGNILLFLRKN